MKRRRKNESGYALLIILLMGAILAISLYREIPRIAFETQRQKEQLLIERGEQYKRAIQLFFRKNQRYPQKIEDLENTNNIRYLRKRYKDPMTGKDEWRVIHIAGGVLTDSKIESLKNQDTKNKGPLSTYLGEVAGLGQQLAPGANGQPAGTPNLALRRRDSDNLGPGGLPVSGNPNTPGAVPGGMAGVAGQPMGGVPGQPGFQPGMPNPNQPGMPNQVGVPNQVGMPNQPGMPPIQGIPPVGIQGQIIPGGRGAVPGIPGSAPPGSMPGGTNAAANSGGSSYLGGGSSYLGGGGYMGGQPSNPTGVGMVGTNRGGVMPPGGFPPGTPVNSQTGGVAPIYSTAAGSNGPAPGFGGQPGVNVNPQAQSAAAQMIGQILTQPRPGGMPMNNTQGVAGGGNGIAGFASNADQDSIMIYQDQQNYGLWEFIFDPAKQKLPLNLAGGGQVGTPASQMGNQIGTPANQVGQPVAPSPFGQQQPTAPSPFGGGFGQPPQMPQGGRRQ